MKDREFLIWVHERLENVHGENPLVDYMHKLRNIILVYPKHKTSKNKAQFNDIDSLKKHLEETEL
jgi:hypothetical protein